MSVAVGRSPCRSERANAHSARPSASSLRSKTFVIGALIVALLGLLGDRRLASDAPRPARADAATSSSRRARNIGSAPTSSAAMSSPASSPERRTPQIAPLATLLGIARGNDPRAGHGLLPRTRRRILGRIIDAFLALPLIVIAVTALFALGSSKWTLTAVIGVVFTPIVARTVRAAVLGERNLEYVEAARLRGEHGPYVMFAEILPERDGADHRRGDGSARLRDLRRRRRSPFSASASSRRRPTGSLQISENYTLLSSATTGGRWCSRRSAIASLVVAVNLIADGVAAGARPMSRGRPRRRPHAAATRSSSRPRRRLPGPRTRPSGAAGLSSLTVRRGEAYGLVGESGCGKSTAALAIVQYLPRNGRVRSGAILIDGPRRARAPRREPAPLRATTSRWCTRTPARR